jgi:regulator of protease activity HflC (stomatin/prohibitin superfamily)
VKTIPINQMEIQLHTHKVTTMDSVELSVKAILIVRIIDPLLAISNFDASTTVLRERAEAVLCNIFSTVNYRERDAVSFHRHHHPDAKGKQADDAHPSAAMPNNTLYSTAQTKFKANFALVMEQCGVQVVQFGVVEALPTDKTYLRTMSEAAKMDITVEKNLRKANGERDVQAQELENEMERAQRRQEIVEIETTTEVNRIAAIGEAEAEALRIMVSAAGESPYAIAQLHSEAVGQLGSTPGTLIFGEAPFARVSATGIAGATAAEQFQHAKESALHSQLPSLILPCASSPAQA